MATVRVCLACSPTLHFLFKVRQRKGVVVGEEEKRREQERIKGTEKASTIHTLFHR